MDKRLKTLKVLIVDCQATHPSPCGGRLLEIGWAVTTAGEAGAGAAIEVDSYLVRQPEDSEIPKAVSRVTGIHFETLKNGFAPEEIWRQLNRCIRETAAAAGLERCPAVIHFARYETPWLKNLFDRCGSGHPFPLQVVCTHEMARRLLPGLPRKGLRAVAGYFGHNAGNLRRCTSHVIATALIWHRLVRELENTASISGWNALHEWLAGTAPQLRTGRNYPLDPEIRKGLPDRPGIYRMLRSNGDLLYVGKAKSLNKRVDSYFRPGARHAEHTLEMLSQARRLEVTPTATALEAAVLECDLIKESAPPYNVALKKAERKLFFCSRDLLAAGPRLAGRRRVGPFPSPLVANSLKAFARWWSAPGRPSADHSLAILHLPPGYQPPADCAREGLELFYRTVARAHAGSTALRVVTALGAKIWKERIALAELRNDVTLPEESTADETDRATDVHEWSPEAVSRAIEHMVSHAAHMLRRSRWFDLLRDANLAWQPHDAGETLRLVEIRKSRLSRCCFHHPEAAFPVPDGHRRRRRERRCDMDLAAYDRLRVITTEIRRLTREKRQPAVCLGPGRILNGNQLRQLFRWI
jgi:DNA polymerase-3 subunit epsilon